MYAVDNSFQSALRQLHATDAAQKHFTRKLILALQVNANTYSRAHL